jgi:DNA-binding NarL/FixJ family response regulator
VIRVLVAASSAVVRAGLEAILARDPSIAVVGEGTLTLAEEIAEHEPDVVVMELTSLHDEDPIAGVRVAAAGALDVDGAGPALVVLTDESDPLRHAEALDIGVCALLPRSAEPAAILAAVSGAATGIVSIAADWARELVRVASGMARQDTTYAAAPPAAATNLVPALTAREIEVLRLIADGSANKHIAARLGISEHTVKFHVSSLFTKLRASTRAEAVVIGARRGLIIV